jgi:hypothetical protein
MIRLTDPALQCRLFDTVRIPVFLLDDLLKRRRLPKTGAGRVGQDFNPIVNNPFGQAKRVKPHFAEDPVGPMNYVTIGKAFADVDPLGGD